VNINFIKMDTINNTIVKSELLVVKVYNNADTDKLQILSDNKGKAGIYQWTHNESLGPSPKNVCRFCSRFI
jgi:hypothetical protein